MNIREILVKKLTIFLAFLTVLFCDGISGVSYFEYNSGNASEGEDHGFYMSRTYLTYKNSISDELAYTFIADVGKIDATPIDDEKWHVYLKKAQLDWKVAENAKLSMGLIGMNMFNIQEKTWGNRFVEKSAMDKYGFSSSADMGFGFSYAFESFSSSLLITNGEGYKQQPDDDYEKISLQLLYGESRLDNNDGFNAGLVYSSNKNENNGTTETHTVSGLFGGWSGKGITIGLESNAFETSSPAQIDITKTLTSVYINYEINDIFKLIAKYDNHDPNEDTANTEDEETKTVFGFVWNPTKGLSISPNITETSICNASGIEVDNEMLSINFQFKF